jgi:predicted DCC family thiol-disulfide oxidoreductase YuxK
VPAGAVRPKAPAEDKPCAADAESALEIRGAFFGLDAPRFFEHSAGMSERTRILFDGDCPLCRASVRFLKRHSAPDAFEYIDQNTPEAHNLLLRLNVQSGPAGTLVLIEDGAVFTRSTAVLRAARHLQRPWKLFHALLRIPARWRDALYDGIARHRHRLFRRPGRFKKNG